MTVDMQKLALRRLLASQSTEFYNKLTTKFFSDTNLLIFRKISKFYEHNMRIPSAQELLASQRVHTIKNFLEEKILPEGPEDKYFTNTFIAEHLQNYYIREETITWLDKFTDQLENLDRTEIIDNIQGHILELHKFVPEGEELFDVATLDTFLGEEKFVMYPSGLSTEYDAINGGFGLEELIMVGGRRGSGKSIITLNNARHQFCANNNSVLFMSIEMRYIEVYYRLMSMLSGIPFMKFIRNDLSIDDKIAIAKTKVDTFYKTDEKTDFLVQKLLENKNIKEFDLALRTNSVSFKDKRFHIVDDANLSLPKIDHYLNLMTNKYDVKLCVVDYLNIVKVEDRMDWKSQIAIADQLKTLSRKYKVMMITPYQIDATGEARFAKGVLDSADRSFRFTPADLNEDPSILPFEISKIRNGKAMKFNVHMDWECLKVIPESSKVVPGKILNKYGNDSVETSSEAASDLG